MGKRFLRAFAVSVTICVIAVACERRQSEAHSTDGAPQTGNAPPTLALASFPADPGSGLEYQLAIDPCVQTKCPVVVRLTKGNRALDSQQLEWSATTQEATPEDVDAQWGAGDPLELGSSLKAFATGEEASYLSTVARPVKVTADRVGLLVTQRGGWEHLKHHRDLFLIDGEKLHREWTGAEGEGPTWSSTSVVQGAGKVEQILFFTGFLYPTAEKPDHLAVWRVVWDAQQKKMVQSAADDATALQLVSFGGYTSITRARAARERADSCIPPLLWVLDSTLYKGAPGKFLLGTITAHPEFVAPVLSAVQRCSPPLHGIALRYQETQ